MILYTYTQKNKDVLAYNNRKISIVSNLIVLIESKSMGKASSMSNENFNSLMSNIFLYIGVKVVLTRNYLNVGLSNGSMGIKKELFYNANKPAPALPKFIFIDFDIEYTGDTLS